MSPELRVGLALVVLVGIAVGVLTLARVRMRADLVVATLRGAVQLAAVAVIIAWVFRHPEGMAVYLPVMLGVAALTAGGRIGLGRWTLLPLVGAIAAGTTCAVVPVLLSGALETDARTVLPFTAQLIGGSMTAAALTGLRLREDVRAEWQLVEGWLALGAQPRQAVSELARRAVARALVPAVDQTRSAGLVTLPGAFVGLLLGGASVAYAAQVQVLVLVGLLAAEAVTGVLTARALAGRLGTLKPDADAG